MGNETSSVKINSLLTAEDIKRLRAGFPVRIYLVTTVLIRYIFHLRNKHIKEISHFRAVVLGYKILKTWNGDIGRQYGL